MINGYTYRTTVGDMGGVCMLPLSAEKRQGAGVSASQDVDVDLELDTEPREVAVPADPAEALGRNDDARHAFDTLSDSAKRRHVLSVDGAKGLDTRRRRIDAVIASLRDKVGNQ
jgi:uncharacterized protein YdeI (YjbR/CyaY-like superfamily)